MSNNGLQGGFYDDIREDPDDLEDRLYHERDDLTGSPGLCR